MISRSALAVVLLLCSGLVFAQSGAPVVRFTVDSFSIVGENPLSPDVTASILDPFTGEHEGLEGLLSAAAALEQEIISQGFSFRRVVLPPQNLRGGNVVLNIVQFTLSEIIVEGNQHFSTDNILRSVPGLVAGEVPSTRHLGRSVRLANQHPSKTLGLTFRESEETNSIDAQLRVNDSRPWSVFASLNNTGNEDTGETRISIGAQHSNLFDRDHAVTGSYSTSPEEPDKVAQYGFNYSLPFYRIGGGLNVYLTSSDVSSGSVGDFFEISGEGQFFGARYTHAFLNIGQFAHNLSVALDDKYFRNVVDFTSGQTTTTASDIDVRSQPLSLTYSGSYPWRDLTLGFRLEYANNIPGGADNDDEAYAAAAADNAPEDWSAIRFGGSATYPFGASWLAIATLDGQQSGDPLIAGEQFGLGGASSVRGYQEREAAGDSGHRLSLELWAPPLAGVRTLVFLDSGEVSSEDRRTGNLVSSIESTQLSSFGAGLRWNWREYVSVSFDIASVSEDAVTTESGDTLGHINVIARY